MNILCSICARSGSKGLSNKNILKINRKPLISHTFLQAKKSKIFTCITLSTDSNKIIDIAKQHKIDFIIKRSKKLSHDSADKTSAIIDLLKQTEKEYKLKFDIIVDLDVTAPLRKISDIKKSISYFNKKNSTNLITVTESRKNPYFNMIEFSGNKVKLVSCKLNNKYKTRQSAPRVYEVTPSIFIWKRDYLMKSKKIISDKTCIYELPYERSIDIDSKNDFKYVEYLMKKNL